MLKVSILLATFNSEKYISLQLESIISQDYKNWVLFISDDGSTDTTLIIVASYVNKYPEKIKLLKKNESLKNPKDNFIFLLSSIESSVYFFCDHDDVWDQDKISSALNIYTEGDDRPDRKSVV